MMNFRPYDPEKDKKAAHRIWYEVGWMDAEKEEKGLEIFLAGGRALVAELNGEAECLVVSMPGHVHYQDQVLPFGAVAGVATSRVARKQGLAKRLAAQLVAADVADGALVSGLGMFEQGFYNQLGFGTGVYEHWISFDPAQLNLQRRHRVPKRLNKDDWQIMHQALLARQKRHGSLNILPEAFTQGELHARDKDFGLGYCDGPNGELTHFFWGRNKRGSFSIGMMAYQTGDQFLELMALLKSLGDQTRLVGMQEPPHIQVQDLITQPFRYRQLTRKSDYESSHTTEAYWQLRLCDLPACLTQTHLRGEAVHFNLKLSDPIARHLPEDAPWRGVTGDYVVTLGPLSGAELGQDKALPTLTASVNAFTRMWFGIRPASGLAVTDDLAGPPELLAQLDAVLTLPVPQLGWDF